MPRGRKKAITNPSEEIEMIDQKIADLQEIGRASCRERV